MTLPMMLVKSLLLPTLLSAGSLAAAATLQDGGAAAQDEDVIELSPSTTEALQAEDARSLPISLDAALSLAETNNLGLLLQDISTEVAHFNALGSWGAFDFVLGANARYTDSERDLGTAFGGADLGCEGSSNRRTESYGLSLERALETGGALSLSWGADQDKEPDFITAGKQTNSTLALSYSQPLLRGFGHNRATSDQQESEVVYLQQVEQRRQTLQALLRDTSNAYWDLVRARRQVEVAESSLALGREQRDRNQRLLDAGVGTEVEVIQAEAEVATRQETRLLAEVNQRIAGDALKALLFPGEDPESWDTLLVPTTAVPEDVSVDDLPPWTQVLEVAQRERPELRIQELGIHLAKIRHERAISDRRMGLDFDVSATSVGFESEFSNAIEEAGQLEFMTYTAGLVLNAPLQNRTAAYAERAARSQVRSARINYEQTETQVVSEVRDAVRQLHYQSLAVAAAAHSLRAAERQLAAEEARYENDLSTNFQVLEFQQQLVEAMNSELTARVNFAKAQYQLQAAQGTLGDRP